MSHAKARDLMRLAEMAAARHSGVSLAEIAEAFDADHRTAQRMVRALEDTFPGVEIRIAADRRRRWKLRDPGLARIQGIRDDELAALEMSIRRAEREGASPDVAALSALRDRLLAIMPGPHARRAEADAEALLEAQGFTAAAATTAREFVFHPGQRFEDRPDGSLVVRFAASGWLEMAWHLYQWGDAVEVLAPEWLRDLVEGYRPNNFEALP